MNRKIYKTSQSFKSGDKVWLEPNSGLVWPYPKSTSWPTFSWTPIEIGQDISEGVDVVMINISDDPNANNFCLYALCYIEHDALHEVEGRLKYNPPPSTLIHSEASIRAIVRDEMRRTIVNLSGEIRVGDRVKVSARAQNSGYFLDVVYTVNTIYRDREPVYGLVDPSGRQAERTCTADDLIKVTG